jgi:SAM-dependent methyltransferase
MNFEPLYTALRKKEQRIYTDEQVKLLPKIDPRHTHAREWKLRERSMKRLLNYLHKKNRSLSILEVGCGNGWLSAQLAGDPSWKITGMDINLEELQQAKRVFGHYGNLRFVTGDIRELKTDLGQFDVIIFAASIQYFFPLNKIIEAAEFYLKPGGEIHIVDSIFYPESEKMAAAARSAHYYDTMGFPELMQYYFHHTLEELPLNTEILYDPRKWKNKLLSPGMPFYWVRIKSHNKQPAA